MSELKTLKEFGKIDILINNAGVLIYKPFIETEEKDYDEMLNVNLKGTYFCTKEVLPYMIKDNYGRIVNISSQLGLHGFANLAVYSASKANFAIIGLTESIA